jgi:hypothetical protein
VTHVAPAYLAAAAHAWPFASEAAHRLSLVRLARTDSLAYEPLTRDLALDLTEWLRLRAGGLSLERLRLIIDQAWFDGQPAVRPLARVLIELAATSLQVHGNTVALRPDGSWPARVEAYRWLSLLLPPDLLVAALHAATPHDPPTDHVSLTTAGLDRLLHENPVAETHLHLGAAASFGLLWTATLPALGASVPSESELRGGPFGGGKGTIAMLLAAGVGRLLLGGYLSRHQRVGAAGFKEHVESRSAGIAERAGWAWGAHDGARGLGRALQTLVSGRLPDSLPLTRLQALYRVLLAIPTAAPPRSIADLCARDPLSSWLGAESGGALPETRFLTRAIRYLLQDGEGDQAFARVFWAYVRVRGLVYRHLTFEPGTAGLDWFVRCYARIRPFGRALVPCRMEAALSHSSRDLTLASLEVRTAPSPARHEIDRELRAAAGQALRWGDRSPDPRPEVGVVLHFIKERLGKHGMHADPRQIAHGIRFGAWGYARLRETMAIEAALEAAPELLLVLRGLDVASTELSVPTWAVAPFFLRLRKASQRASAQLARTRPSWRARPLRATAHAGEDFTRLIQGLRRVHELIAVGAIDRGDRLGHALCLGADPTSTAEGEETLEERLDDRLWELDRYTRGDASAGGSRVEAIRDDIRRLGGAVYGTDDARDADTLREARRLQLDPRFLRRVGFPFRRHFEPTSAAERLALRSFVDAGVFRRGQQVVVEPCTKGEIAAAGALQAWLRGLVAEREITVESNPSSNLLIGHRLSLDEHPVFKMSPLPGVQGAEAPLLLSLNSDDPVTFATSLADEYAHLFAALVRLGVQPATALEWLDQRRAHGQRSRFTLKASADRRCLAELAERPRDALDIRRT